MSAPTRLAVLPFVNLSGDARQEHVADGLTELVMTHLATLGLSCVAPRASSVFYERTRQRPGEIARELAVTRIVEGSVLQSSQTIQIAVQVIDAATEARVFSQIYAHGTGDTLQWQNDVAKAIATDIGAFVGATGNDTRGDHG